eukprot:864589-Pyramimonas_sp.AAC.1
MAQAASINCLYNARVQDPRARHGVGAQKAFAGVQVPNARRRVQLASRSLTMRATASVDMKSVIEKL